MKKTLPNNYPSLFHILPISRFLYFPLPATEENHTYLQMILAMRQLICCLPARENYVNKRKDFKYSKQQTRWVLTYGKDERKY